MECERNLLFGCSSASCSFVTLEYQGKLTKRRSSTEGEDREEEKKSQPHSSNAGRFESGVLLLSIKIV